MNPLVNYYISKHMHTIPLNLYDLVLALFLYSYVNWCLISPFCFYRDFGSIFSTLLPGMMAKLDPLEGGTFLDGLEVRC
jgi:ABC-type polysaccharide/polyol phosphate export permease